MSDDDPAHRAIIAAHDAECVCDGDEHYDWGSYRGLTEAEQAIVAQWRDDRDDYQGRYETSHDSRMHAEKRLDDMTREARLSRESTEKAVARARRAEAAIERVHEYAREQDDHSVPASSEEAWELSTRREVSRELLGLLEDTDGR